MSESSIFISEGELGHLLMGILSLLLSSHFFGYIFSKMKLPRVVGEIFGGILLGPSCLGFLYPNVYNHLFNFFPEQGKILSFLYWLGLALLMLTAGFKIRPIIAVEDRKIILNLIMSATILPVLGGILYWYLYDFSPYLGNKGSNLSMAIIVCIAIAITSIPVISKIFLDLNIMESRFAKIVIAAAVLHDLILWVGLDIAVKTSTISSENIFYTLFLSLLFISIFLIFGYKVINFITNSKWNIFIKDYPIVYIICIWLIIVILANYLGINICFGALIAGILIGSITDLRCQKACEQVSIPSLSIFIPIYFAIVGLKINLPSAFDLNLFLSFFAISSILEIGSVCLGLKFIKVNFQSSINFGIAMNTRGGPGIILASIAYEFSIINETFFVILVLVAILTSLISGVWFRYVLAKGLSLYHELNDSQCESNISKGLHYTLRS